MVPDNNGRVQPTRVPLRWLRQLWKKKRRFKSETRAAAISKDRHTNIANTCTITHSHTQSCTITHNHTQSHTHTHLCFNEGAQPEDEVWRSAGIGLCDDVKEAREAADRLKRPHLHSQRPLLPAAQPLGV